MKDFVLCQQRACKNIISSVLKVKTLSWTASSRSRHNPETWSHSFSPALALLPQLLPSWVAAAVKPFGLWSCSSLRDCFSDRSTSRPSFLLKRSHLWGKALHDDPFLLLRMLTCSYPPCHSWLLTGFSLGYQTKTLSLFERCHLVSENCYI